MKKYLLFTMVLLLAMSIPAFGAVSVKDTEVTFTCKAPDAKEVFLSGAFNGWSPNATLMTKNADGVWSITMQLDPGRYQYKYVIDGVWTPDNECAVSVDDGYDGKNSLFLVTE